MSATILKTSQMSQQAGGENFVKQQSSPAQIFRGIVKQVTSGDCIMMRTMTKDGRNLEKQVMLANITAPRLARGARRDANPNDIEPDQPYAFEAREFLRAMLVGKEVCFVKETNNNSNVDRGTLYLGKDCNGVNIIEALISEGLAEVRRFKNSEEENRLIALEEQAKSLFKGKWSKDPESDHVRNIKWTVDNATHFVDSHRQKPIDAIIEYVRDGSTLRCLLVPSYNIVTVQLSGIKCPMFKREGDIEVPEPFAEDAKFFVETRLLQKDVKVILEGVANQANGILLGSILHPNGNIAEFLLKDGFAKCVDWSMGVVTGGADKYRTAEKMAKEAKLRVWKNYTSQSSNISEADKNFSGKVVDINSGDSIMIKQHDGTFKKIFLSSIRPPRSSDYKDLKVKADRKNVQLYDVPYLFEAREFLRKKLIGKKVNLIIDYIQPAQENYPEKLCCTVMLGETNIAEAIVSHGLAKVIRYKQDDDQRSSKYDDLLSAESRAAKKLVGVHSVKEPTTMKIQDISGDVNKAKQFFPTLQRNGRIDALVEYVSSGSRFKLYMPKETCLLTLLLSGLDCPRLGRPAYGTNAAQTSDPFAEEAFAYSKGKCLMHECKVEIEAIDKGGNFIGQIWTDEGVNIAVGLIEQGYAAVYKNASNNQYFSLMSAAEQKAKDSKLNRWKNFVEEPVILQEDAAKNEPQERVVNQKLIVITEVNDNLHFYGQFVDSGSKLEGLMSQMRTELEAQPPVPGAYTARVGELCVAKFSQDEEWYRARVLTAPSNGSCNVIFIDFGNSEKVATTDLAHMPAGFDTLPAQAHEYALACVQLGADEDDIENAVDYFRDLVSAGGEYNMNIEYRNGSIECVTIIDAATKVDIGKKMVMEGYLSVDRTRREKRFAKLLNEYFKVLTAAKQAHKMMWRYGDKEQEDAAEFGMTARKQIDINFALFSNKNDFQIFFFLNFELHKKTATYWSIVHYFHFQI